MLTAVDHVQLAAPPGSEDALRAYYGDVLGMTAPRPRLLVRGRYGPAPPGHRGRGPRRTGRGDARQAKEKTKDIFRH